MKDDADDLFDLLALCPLCGAVIMKLDWTLALHERWHYEQDPITADPDLEAERTTHHSETHAQLTSRVRRERAKPYWGSR